MNNTDLKRALKPLAGPVLVPLVFFWRELTGLSVFAGFDFTHLILPFQQFARDALNSGTLPQWNPYLFAGFPQLAEGEGGLYYPGNFLLWLPINQSALLAWTIVLHLILTGLLMYFFLVRRGASRKSAAWLSVFYQFLPGMLLRMETVGLFEAVCLLPGLFLAFENAVTYGVEKNKRMAFIWTIFAGIILSFMFLAGSSQIAFYGMIGVFFFLCGLITMGPHPMKRTLWSVGLFLLVITISILLAAVQLIPTSEFAKHSFRVIGANYDYFRMGTWLNTPRLASLFMFPALRLPSDLLDYISSLGYIGILPAILVTTTLVRHKRHMNPILPAFILVFFGLILSFGMNFVANQDLITFPGFSMFRALGRMILPTVIGLFGLAAVGLDSLFHLSDKEKSHKPVTTGIIITVLVALILIVWATFHEGLPPLGFQFIGYGFFIIATLASLIGLIGYISTRKTAWLTGTLIAWLILHLIAFAPLKSAMTMKTSTFKNAITQLQLPEEINPDDGNRPMRVLVASEDDIWDPLMESLAEKPFSSPDFLPLPAVGNELALANIGVLNGYTPLVTFRWYTVMHEYAAGGLNQVEEASNRLRMLLSLSCCDAVITPETFTGGDDLTELDHDLNLAYPVGWHALNTPGTVEYIGFPSTVAAWEASDWEWFKHWIVQEGFNPGEIVCVELRDDYPLPDGMEWNRLELPEDGIEEQEFPTWATMEFPDSEVPEILYTDIQPGIINLRVNSDEPRWMVIRESWMPGWHARIDGNEVPVACADYLFMGIPIPEGEHTIELIYLTPGLLDGALVSGISWAILLIVLVSLFLVRKKKT